MSNRSPHGTDPLEVLHNVGAVLQGHFQYTSGRHGDVYVEKFRLLENPDATDRLCGQIADAFREQMVELVVGPTTGGILVAFSTARQLGLENFFAEKIDNGPTRALKRGFSVRPGQRTLIVDDVLTTGGSLLETIEAVKNAGGNPIGVGVIVDRTAGKTQFNLPFFSCMMLDIDTYSANSCRLCDDGIPLIVT